ncbi:class I SAM-dependent methyltransferase family protein [Candidatus Micrarchaeota archaeon]|nr:class I SAM-dependent methyltransferase family protein [Candidatus Micrarchaeota archaeon]
MKTIGLKIEKKKAEETRRKMEKYIRKDLSPKVEKGYVIFPLTERTEGYKIVEAEFRKREPQRERKLKILTKGILSGMDIIGDIAILELKDISAEKEKEIGMELLKAHPNIKAVYKKLGAMEGKFRVRKLGWLAGEKRTVTEYRESGARIMLDVAKVYFSPRLSAERNRIKELVKDGEVVLSLFAGVGPYPLVIAKERDVEIYAVELNPDAVEYLKKNIEINKLKGKIHPIKGDVREVVPKQLRRKGDRVIMSLPMKGSEFLEECVKGAKEGGIVHFYTLLSRGEKPDEIFKRIQKAAENTGRTAGILNWKKVRPYSPSKIQIVIDFRVT